MIVLVTSNSNGGILQFSIQILRACLAMGLESILFVPEKARINDERIIIENNVKYKKAKGIFSLKQSSRDICDLISSKSPELVWFMDEGIISKSIIVNLKVQCTIMMTIHDVNPHISYFSIYQSYKNVIKQILRYYSFRYIDRIVLLSEYGKSIFTKRYKSYNGSVHIMPLGAHVPNETPEKPKEIIDMCEKFLLFFGRIDKYKGVDVLVDAFRVSDIGETIKLVIAGSGNIPKKLITRINQDSNIILINRYVANKEMLYLFKNANTVILPYKEITQSGVLVMAYHFDKPVIISNLPGLEENVINNVTGYIYNTKDEFVDILNRLTNNKWVLDLHSNVHDYYYKKFEWEKNIAQLLSDLRIGGTNVKS